MPGCPKGGQPRHEQNSSKRHSQTRTAGRTPSQRDKDQEVDRCVFKKVDAVSEERNRSDSKSHGELYPKICQIENRHESNNAPQICLSHRHAR